jgi:hypothetical protein
MISEVFRVEKRFSHMYTMSLASVDQTIKINTLQKSENKGDRQEIYFVKYQICFFMQSSF